MPSDLCDIDKNLKIRSCFQFVKIYKVSKREA